jgi:hypothetical protein
MHSISGLQVGVLGTGLSALSAAYYLKKSGHCATVLDIERGTARPGRSFSYCGGRLDQFLQTVTRRDLELHALIAEIGVDANLQWHAEPGRGLFRLIGRTPGVATCMGLAAMMERELRSRLTVEPIGEAIDLLEFDHCIEIRTDRGRRQFDAMIATVPIDTVEDIARGLIAQELPCNQAHRRTLANVVFVSASPLLRKFSTFVESTYFPFTTVASTTDVDSKLSVIHIAGYSDVPGLELRLLATRFLCENFPEFQPSNVSEVRVFQSTERIPICQSNRDSERIPAQVGESRLFLASRDLSDGMPVSMNTDLLLAREAVNEFLDLAPIFACGARQAEHAGAR